MASFHEIQPLIGRDLRQGIEASIQACELRLGIVLTIHDLHGLCRDAAGDPLLMRRNEHRHPLCRLERRSTFRRCNEHCVAQVHAEAVRSRRSFTTWCWKGIRELVVPLLRDGHVVMLLYAGAWRRPRARPDLTDVPRARSIAELQAALPLLDAGQARELASQLELWGQGLLDLIERSRNSGGGDNRRDRIRRYIETHAHAAMSLADLAAELGCSASRTSHLVREIFDCSFQELLLRERLDRARVLLVSCEHPLAWIAEACGFHNEYYFNRAFAKRIGTPPGRWRQEQRRRWTD